MTNQLIMGIILSSSNGLIKAICYDAIKNHYETSIIKSNQTRYTMKYYNNTCK